MSHRYSAVISPYGNGFYSFLFSHNSNTFVQRRVEKNVKTPRKEPLTMTRIGASWWGAGTPEWTHGVIHVL